MGCRGDIKMKYDNGTEIYFYTHWGAWRLLKDLQTSLNAHRCRWDDDAYLARIIFCGMINDGEYDGETGYGISPYQSGDEELITIDTKAMTVTVEDSEFGYHKASDAIDIVDMPFEEFVKLNLDVVYYSDENRG